MRKTDTGFKHVLENQPYEIISLRINGKDTGSNFFSQTVFEFCYYDAEELTGKSE
jgi:hypothetical protein